MTPESVNLGTADFFEGDVKESEVGQVAESAGTQPAPKQLTEEQIESLIMETYKLSDKHSKYKFIIVNPVFDKQFKEHILKTTTVNLKIMFDEVNGMKYIVSPFIKEKDTPVAYISVLDLNKIAAVNGSYEGEILYIDDLFQYDKKTW